MATRAFDSLVVKHEPRIVKELATIPELQGETLPKGRQVVRLLALLHDIGHPAFSHAAESVLPLPLDDHEAVSVYVIRNVLGPRLDECFFPGTAELLVKLMEKKPEVTFLRQFVVSEIDMDRTDYLRRDSLHCGVDYGHFDFHRLIEAITVVENPETKQVQIGLERGGEHIFEALILARYQMSTQVYYHRLRRIYDRYLTEYMKLWAPEHYTDADDVLKYDDMDLLVQMKADTRIDGPRTGLAKRIINREHHKMVYESGDSTNVMTMRSVKTMFKNLEADFSDVDLIIDVGEGAIHKQLIPDDEKDDPNFDPLYVADRDGTNPSMISLESGILRNIPKRFRNIRIFGSSENRDLSQVKASALKQMKQMNG